MSSPERGDDTRQARDDVSDVDSEQGQPIPLVTPSNTEDHRSEDMTRLGNSFQSIQAHQSSTSWVQRVRRWEWLEEFCCCVLILAALITLIEVLQKAQGQPVPSWRRSHYDISINAVVAILSTMLKGAAVLIVAEVIGQSKWDWFEKPRGLYHFERIDGASRGPWGSAKMIFGLRGPTLGFFGAAITIAALAVDPFTQNIVTSYACQIPTTQPGLAPFVPTADGYFSNTRNNYQFRNGSDTFPLWGTDHYSLDTTSRAAVYSGLFASATSVVNGSIIRLSCPGVNCTFPRYSTLGVCHRCADISSHIKKTCYSSPPDNPDDVFVPACNWSLPTGQSLSSVPNGHEYFRKDDSIRDISSIFAVANSTLSTLTLGNTPGTFTNLTILANSSLDSSCTTVSPDSQCRDWMGAPTFNFSTFAAECALFPCVRTYTATTMKGAVTETEVGRSTANDTDWLQTWWNAPNGAPDEVTITPANENCTQGWEGGPCTYTTDARWIMAAGDFFWRFWNATFTGRDWSHAASTNDALDVLFGEGITNFTHVNQVMAAISDSMTAAIRLAGGADDRDHGLGGGQGVVNGTAYVADTCIGVRWAWIALPTATGGLSIALLVSALFGGMARRRNPAWKCSALPVLFHGVRFVDEDSKSDYLTMAGMEKTAKSLRVRMDRDEKGFVHLVPESRGV